MSNHKYTDDGKKVLVVGELNANQTIVQEIYVSGEQEIPSGSNFVVTNLHDEPVESWKERRLREVEERYESRMEEMEREYKKAQRCISEATEKAELRANALFAFAKNADDSQLQRLHDFVAGNITHFFVNDYSNPQITTWEDDCLYQMESGMGRRKIEELKLVSLVGKSKGNLAYRIGQYSDGSGGMGTEIIPCRNYNEALAEAQAALDFEADEYVSGNRGFLNLDKWKKIDGIRIPQEAADKERQHKEQNRLKRIKELQQKIDELRAEE